MPAVTGEIYVNGGWVDITADLYDRDEILITRGAKDEGGRADPTMCSATINNRSGNYCPYNPNGIYYGQIGLNTPFRLKVDGNIRGAVELSSLPQRWDLSGLDVYVPVQGYGIRKRLSTGQDPLRSTMYRGNTSFATLPVAYWPCEDGSKATLVASGLAAAPPMSVNGTVDFAAYSGFECSEPIPTLKAAYFDGAIPAYGTPSPNKMQIRYIVNCPTSPEIPNNTIMVDLHNAGTAGLWRIKYYTSGDLGIRVDDRAFGTTLYDGGPIDFNIVGKKFMIALQLAQNGANVDWSLVVLEVGKTTGFFVSNTLNNQTIGRATRVFVDPLQLCSGLSIGHLAVYPTVTTIFDLAMELNAFRNEAAGKRIERLCAQEGIPFTGVGDLTNTQLMGPQRPLTLISLLDECADADAGVLYEPIDQVGLAYRTLADIYNQSATLALDYSAGQIAEPFEPTPDDFDLANDVTAKDLDGNSARAIQETGRLSVLAPGNGGVGRYPVDIDRNVAKPSQLADAAGWAKHLGTVDEPRYPSVALNLLNPRVVAAGKDVQALAVDIADRITIDNPKAGQSPDQIAQLAGGYEERVSKATRGIVFVCAPASPYDVMRPGVAGKSGVDSGSSTLTGGPYAAGVGTLSVATSDPAELWTTSAASFPFDVKISGEVVRVTNITGSSSPQTFTGTRGINNINKTLPDGSAVVLARRPTIGY